MSISVAVSVSVSVSVSATVSVTAFAVHPTCVSLASPRSRCAYGYTGLGSVKSAFITGRLIKQFFTPGAKKQMLIQKEKSFVL